MPISGLEEDASLVVLDQFFMAADIRGDKELALGHGFERLERGDEFGQAHRVARVSEDVDQVVIAADFIVWHAAGEDDMIFQAKQFDLLAEIGFLRATADEQQANVRLLFNDGGQGGQEQVETFVGVEGADEADHGFAGQLPFLL